MGDTILSINSYQRYYFPCLQFNYSSVFSWDAIFFVYSSPTILFLPGMPFSLSTVYLQFCFYLGCHFHLQFCFNLGCLFRLQFCFYLGCHFHQQFSFYLGCHSLSTVYLQFCFYLGCHFHLQFCFYLGCHFHQ